MVNFNHHKLSIIIPLYNEPEILQDLKLIEAEVKKSFSDYEIICVDDGSRDDTLTKLNGYRSPHIKIISYPMNVGKGFALCFGFSKSTGDIIAFYDGDLDIHPRHIRIFTDLLDLIQADIVIGSKRHSLSVVYYSPVRRLYSKCYQLLVHLLFGLNVSDTQVGLKLFRRRVLNKVLPRLVVKTWAFDLELLVVAKFFGFTKVIEAPIRLSQRQFGSKVSLMAAKNIVQDTLAIFYRRYIRRYYHQPPGTNIASTKKMRLNKARIRSGLDVR